MSPSTFQSFRNSFYHTLTKGAVSDTDANNNNIHTWQPSPNNANLKSYSQLQEWIYIVQNWNIGANGLDVGAFRAKYKTFYSRMKPATCNLGRRTGMHLRKNNDEDNGGGAVGNRSSDGGGGGVSGSEEGAPSSSSSSSLVLCRYNKAGNKSIMYLDVGRVSLHRVCLNWDGVRWERLTLHHSSPHLHLMQNIIPSPYKLTVI